MALPDRHPGLLRPPRGPQAARPAGGHVPGAVRATLAACDPREAATRPLDAEHARLLERYREAFERYDVTALVALLHAEATMSMPPYALWLRGPADVAAWLTGPGAACEGSRLLVVRLNGQLALAQYKPAAGPGDASAGHVPWALVLLGVRDGLVGEQVFFLDADRGLFERCGLPTRLGPDCPDGTGSPDGPGGPDGPDGPTRPPVSG